MASLADHLPIASQLLPRPGSPPGEHPEPSGDLGGTGVANSLPAVPAHALDLLGEHGDGLLKMARVITGDLDLARTVVSAVLATAATPSLNAPPESDASLGNQTTRTMLAAAIFRACRTALGDDVQIMETAGNDTINWLARISAQQRSAVALYLHGAQTPAQIASLLNLPARTVSLLLLSAMDELIDADPTARPRRGPQLRPRHRAHTPSLTSSKAPIPFATIRPGTTHQATSDQATTRQTGRP